MDAFKLLLEFFFGKSKTGYKAFAFIVIIVLVVLVNQSMGFTYNYYYSKKIDNISKLQNILNNQGLANDQRVKIIELQNDIITSTRALNINLRKNRTNNFWYIMSYCGLLILTGIIGIITTIKSESASKRGKTIFGMILIIVLLSGFLTFFGLLTSFIPSAVLSYTLNICFQIICIWSLVYIGIRMTNLKGNQEE